MVKFRVKPSQKENWRYIAFEVISETKPLEADVVKAIMQSIIRFLGETGASKTNAWLLNYEPEKKIGIIRCSHTAQKEVLASITTITSINEAKALLNIPGVSGSIKKVNLKYLQGQLKRKFIGKNHKT